MIINWICFAIVCFGWAFSTTKLEDKYHIAFWGWLCGAAATCIAKVLI